MLTFQLVKSRKKVRNRSTEAETQVDQKVNLSISFKMEKKNTSEERIKRLNDLGEK